MKHTPTEEREQETRWRLDQLTSSGNELLWRTRQIARQIEGLVRQLLEEEARKQHQEPEHGA